MLQIKRGDSVETVSVETGQFNERFIEIREGLTAGDQVSLSPKIEEPSKLNKGKTQAAVGR